ncbi:uncharacterized protein TRIREDRAFT_106270 [Trichoderma reesei QM6a]|jgi:hypothetical protein|uniref:Predicted protein n=2 Tax=Hypocrea jecorina TaxID=51453 RepID=G0RHH1_HYPJQ|nr:uncharacterized protein TRIREDRAFT_106270 [Trichoderma reesei QM6a]EGR49506.1 predicted protein [Trichoderma reesei QM6a]ETS03100.1 hypothetical protein M419DRAFT_76840 [Trichoderma reesei RUT C-30]
MALELPAGAAETIVRKKAKYCRLADSNAWHLADEVFLPDFEFKAVDDKDAVIHINDTDYHWTSLADWVAYFSKTFAPIQTMHVVGYPELELVAPDEISAVFGVQYFVGTKEVDKGLHGTGGGHYFETWKLKDGDWFIQKIKFVRIYWKEMTL